MPRLARDPASSASIQARTASKRSPSSRGDGRRDLRGSGNVRTLSLLVCGAAPAETAQASRRPWSHSRCTCAKSSSGPVHAIAPPSPGAPQLLGAVFLDGEVAQTGAAALLVVHEADGRHVGLDDVDLLERCYDQELQAHLLEQVEAEPRGLVGAAPERLVDHHEVERARAQGTHVEAELVGETSGQDGVGELLLLATRFSARVRVVLMLAVVGSPTLRGREHE